MTKDHKNILRHMRESDLEFVRSWRNHGSIREYMFHQDLISSQEHRVWFEKAQHDSSKELFIFENDLAPQGFAQVKYSYASSVAEWGFYAAPEAPSGTGTEMLSKVLDYVFEVRGSFRIHAQVLEHNLASLRLHEKLGFTREGILRQHYLNDTRRYDVHCFGILFSEWKR